ncbi:unnamed protein product [Lymnaea stagnalis]|uniref:Uncharacterized protein n=1 Tax=Lymnaea stagnalis TaxID=6523 RepID=A0AAV2IAT6_LYMST
MAEIEEPSHSNGKSQYSESIVLNQDFADLTELETELHYPTHKQSDVNTEPAFLINVESSPILPKPKQIQQPGNHQAKLRERLYDKPENSGVMQYVRMQALRKRPFSGVDVQGQTKQSTILEPLSTTLPKRNVISSYDQIKPSHGLTSKEKYVLQSM